MTLNVPVLNSAPLSPHPSAAREERDLFTMPRAAEKLSISKRTLERLIASGTFPPPVKIGRSSRVLHADIATYLEKLRRERGDRIGTS